MIANNMIRLADLIHSERHVKSEVKMPLEVWPPVGGARES